MRQQLRVIALVSITAVLLTAATQVNLSQVGVQLDPSSFYLDNATTPPTLHWTGGFIAPPGALQHSPPAVQQADGSWTVSAALPHNPAGGVPITPYAVWVIRNGIIVWPDGPDQFQVTWDVQGQMTVTSGPVPVSIIPALNTPLTWTATDDVRIAWTWYDL